MNSKQRYTRQFILLGFLFIIALLMNISLGSVHIPFDTVLSALLGSDQATETQQYIISSYRMPKAITAILTGAALSLSGLIMQTFFRNPLAGPFVLGISSGASLGVALLLLGGSAFATVSVLTSGISLAIAASLGSFIVLLCILVVASRVRDTMALLIIGLMFGSITTAAVSVMSYFARMESLQQYIFWSFGSLGDLSWSQIRIFAVLSILGIILSIAFMKPLNSLLLGENYAKSLGMNVQRVRFVLILITSILAGSVTAFAGPIAFIGLAVPHLTRQIFRTPDHRVLLPAVLLFGAILMLICDTLSQLPGYEFSLPVNAITSLVGAPVVIWLLVRKKSMLF
ncbi:iron ABC transporter permease [Robertkochia marina]|uniref:Iron ABC transporter permease n=1 Tax=Robertkochia marina TaxID=1227945 RepID=A0A4V3UY27_9FLAO|nr:iron ABC transporter permease [Robertkochia marina]THD67466.1 iron ABC transporter permease [Robertkochia marina]TRZ44665.1 iron ABC transporter permease [Robertkochia marina]